MNTTMTDDSQLILLHFITGHLGRFTDSHASFHSDDELTHRQTLSEHRQNMSDVYGSSQNMHEKVSSSDL